MSATLYWQYLDLLNALYWQSVMTNYVSNSGNAEKGLAVYVHFIKSRQLVIQAVYMKWY